MTSVWLVCGFLFSVPCSLLLISFLHSIHQCYLKFITWRDGILTTARLIHIWSETHAFHAKFTFTDNRTHSYLYKVIEREMLIQINNQWRRLPNDIINLCIEFIGYESVIFCYGSFTVTNTINRKIYKQLSHRVGHKIDIIYYEDYPQGAQINLQSNCCSHTNWKGCCSVIMVVYPALCIVLGYYIYLCIIHLSMIEAVQMLIIFSTFSIMFTIIGTIYYGYRKHIWCFKQGKYLQITNSDDDHVIQLYQPLKNK